MELRRIRVQNTVGPENHCDGASNRSIVVHVPAVPSLVGERSSLMAILNKVEPLRRFLRMSSFFQAGIDGGTFSDHNASSIVFE